MKYRICLSRRLNMLVIEGRWKLAKHHAKRDWMRLVGTTAVAAHMTQWMPDITTPVHLSWSLINHSRLDYLSVIQTFHSLISSSRWTCSDSLGFLSVYHCFSHSALPTLHAIADRFPARLPLGFQLISFIAYRRFAPVILTNNHDRSLLSVWTISIARGLLHKPAPKERLCYF